MIENYLTTADVMKMRSCSRKTAIRLIQTHGGFKLWGMWIVERAKLEATHD